MSHPVFEGLSIGVTPPYAGSPLDWLEEHARLPHSCRSTLFDRDQAPWLNAIIEDICDDSVKQVVIRSPTGGGKTTLLELSLLWIVANQSGPVLSVGQTDKTAAQWMETRLKPVLEACVPVAKLFPEDRHKKRKAEIIFPHMPLFAVGANMSSLQEKSVRYVFCDEVWRWDTGKITEARARFHSRWNQKLLLVSQGWDQGHDMDGEWESGEKFTWGTTCEGCAKWHPYLWANIKWVAAETEDGAHDWPRIADSVRHECPNCGHVTPDTTAARREMSMRGEYRAEEGNFVSGKRSRTYTAFGVWWCPWAEEVTLFLHAKAEAKNGNLEPLKQFVQKRCAEVWKDEEKGRRDWSVIGERKGSFALETTWDIEQRRFLTVDVQADHFWYVCRAWARGGASRLIAFGKFRSFDEIAGLAESLRVSDEDVAIDSGYDAPAVYRACVGSGYKWKPFKGDRAPYYNVKGTRRAWVDTMVDPGIGTREQGRRKLRLFLYSNPMVKDILALHVRGDAAPWEIAEDAPPEYMDQVTAERKTEKGLWEPTRKDNHAWDLECMQVVCALASGIMFPEVEAPKLTPRTAANGESELASDIPSIHHARTSR